MRDDERTEYGRQVEEELALNGDETFTISVATWFHRETRSDVLTAADHNAILRQCFVRLDLNYTRLTVSFQYRGSIFVWLYPILIDVIAKSSSLRYITFSMLVDTNWEFDYFHDRLTKKTLELVAEPPLEELE